MDPLESSDVGWRDAIRIMRLCRQATAHLAVPKRQSEVDAYMVLCTEIVVPIIAAEIKRELPE